jgi:hypothetical protein
LKKRLSLEVQGTHKLWAFDIMADPKHMDEWLADGLKVSEVIHTIPVWIVELGLIRPWIFLQDLWNFKRSK